MPVMMGDKEETEAAVHGTVTIGGVELRRVDEDEYEGANPARDLDYSIRREGEKWVADIFDSRIEDADEAALDSVESDTLEEAVEAAHFYERGQR